MASHIEHSFLQPDTGIKDIEQLCKEAMQYHFAAVCVPPVLVKKAKKLLSGSDIKLATVIGFPFGHHAIEAKLAETVLAIVDGADELDMMINLIALKNDDWQYLAKEINTVLSVVRKSKKTIKVIIDAARLTEKKIISCCDLYGAAAVDFIQTSSGFFGPPATLETLKFIRVHLADAVKIKANDSIDFSAACEWIEAGADRIVCHNSANAFSKLNAVKHGMVFENQQHNKSGQ